VLLGASEPDDRPVHPLISHVAVPPLPADLVLEIEERSDNGVDRDALERLSAVATESAS